MQIEGQHSRSSRGRDQVGDQLCADGHPWNNLPVLTRIPIVWDDRCYAFGRGPFESIQHEQEFHQVVVPRRRRGLQNKHVCSADIFLDLDLTLTVTESFHDRFPQRDFEILTDLLSQRRIGISGKDLQFDSVLTHGLEIIPSSPFSQPFYIEPAARSAPILPSPIGTATKMSGAVRS